MDTPATHPRAIWMLTLEVAAGLADDVAAGLLAVGADGAWVEQALHLPSSGDVLAGGNPPLNLPPERARLTLSFGRDPFASAAHVEVQVAQVLAELGPAADAGPPHISACLQRPWSEKWRQHFLPSKFGRRSWVVPAWLSSFEPPAGSSLLRLDPGMAFGTGQHATTALCLQHLERWCGLQSPQARAAAAVLDVGCGSGILGLMAAQLGVGQVEGIDIDPVAVDCARHNLAANPSAARVHIHGAPVADLRGQFNVVLANILAPVLRDMGRALANRLAPGGSLVLSGLLRAQLGPIEALYTGLARSGGPVLTARARTTRGDWGALHLERLPY